MLTTFAPDLGRLSFLLARAGYRLMQQRVRDQFEINDPTITRAHEKLVAAGELFRDSLQPSGYLVGNRFSVADLTLAALLAPIVAPPEFPYPQPQRGHPRLIPVRETLAAEGLLYWTRDMYARHRGVSGASMTEPDPRAHLRRARRTRARATVG
jgi:glutathione S-transferase